MARIGTGINASLGAIDYTPYLRGSVAGSEAISKGIAALGAGIGKGIDRYQQKKQEEDIQKALGNSELLTLSTNIQQANSSPNKELYATAPKVDQQKIDDLRKRINSSNKAERVAAISELNTLNQGFKDAPAKAIQELQFTSAKGALQDQEQERKNRLAMTAAMSNVPTEVTETIRVPETRFGQPKANLQDFLYGGNVTETSKITPGKPAVENVAPAGVSSFLGPNQLTGRYEFIGDFADKEVKRREAELERERTIAKNISESLSPKQTTYSGAGRNPATSEVGLPYVGLNQTTTTTSPTALPDSQRIALQNSLARQNQLIEAKTNELNKVKQQVVEAQRFSGQPLVKPAEDPVITKGISVLRAPMDQLVTTIPSPDVFKKEVEKEIAVVEKKQNRQLTPDERLAILTDRYIAKEGQLSPKIVEELKRTVGADMEFGAVGNAKYVRIGNNVQFFKDKEQLSASMVKEAKQDSYTETLGAFANFLAKNGPEAFYSIPEKYRQALSALHNRFGQEEYDQFGNRTGRKRPLLDTIMDEVKSVYNTPASPSLGQQIKVGRFDVSE